MRHGDDEKAVAAVGNTGQGVVPGQEGGEQSKEAAGLDDAGFGLAVVLDHVSDGQQQERNVQGEEEQEERHRGAERAEQEVGGEIEPALKESCQFR